MLLTAITSFLVPVEEEKPVCDRGDGQTEADTGPRPCAADRVGFHPTTLECLLSVLENGHP